MYDLRVKTFRRFALLLLSVASLPNKNDSDHSSSRPLVPISDSFYFDHANYWEPNVTIALRDVLNPGDSFWDIGANVGGVTRLGSRLVGPQGTVISVEASMANFRKLHNNVTANFLNNVFLLRCAAWDEKAQVLTLYNGDGGNDSLFASDRLLSSTETVTTTTLNELFDLYGLPDLIKLDIEGAELNALLGGDKLLDLHSGIVRPLIILEQSSEKLESLQLLLKSGYILQDLATAELFKNQLPAPQDPITNWLAIPCERETSFARLLYPFEEYVFSPQKFDKIFEIDSLPAGRYRADIDLLAFAGENVYVNIYNDNVLISRYHGDAEWLQSSYRSRQFDFRTAGKLTIRVESPNGGQAPKSRILRVSIFSKMSPRANDFGYVLAP